VLGAGSWGTALAVQFARGGRTVRLWGRDASQVAAMADRHENKRYLPGVRFPESLELEPELARCLHGVRDILIAVPSHALRETLRRIRPLLGGTERMAWATKGFEVESGRLPHQVVEEMLGTERPMAVLSGPTFAREVGAGLPTALTIAGAPPSTAYAPEITTLPGALVLTPTPRAELPDRAEPGSRAARPARRSSAAPPPPAPPRSSEP